MAKPWERTYQQPDQAGSTSKPWERSYQPDPTVAAADQASQARQTKLHDIAMALYHSYAPNAAVSTGDLFGQNYTGYLTKPMDALANTVTGAVQGYFGYGDVPEATMGERWAAYTKAYDDKIKEAQQRAGTAGTVAQVTGSVTSPLNLIGMEAASPVVNAASQLGVGALQGAAEHSNTLSDATTGAGVGALTSAIPNAAVGLTKPLGSLVRYGGEKVVDRLGRVMQAVPGDNPTVNALARRAGLAVSGLIGGLF